LTDRLEDLPEELAEAVAVLVDATERAAPTAHFCVNCHHVDTLRVDRAEAAVLNVIRRLYVPDPVEGVRA